MVLGGTYTPHKHILSIYVSELFANYFGTLVMYWIIICIFWIAPTINVHGQPGRAPGSR
jgi:hypothetical protein